MTAAHSERNMIRQTALFVVFALIAVHVPAEEPKGECSPPPWHLVDLWWGIGQDTPFESYSIDVEISDDVASMANLYIAQVALGYLGKTPFYGGIQSQSDGYTKQDQHLRKIGPGLIFSMW